MSRAAQNGRPRLSEPMRDMLLLLRGDVALLDSERDRFYYRASRHTCRRDTLRALERRGLVQFSETPPGFPHVRLSGWGTLVAMQLILRKERNR